MEDQQIRMHLLENMKTNERKKVKQITIKKGKKEPLKRHEVHMRNLHLWHFRCILYLYKAPVLFRKLTAKGHDTTAVLID
jgi:hypothetical protein